jgi:antitoxin (DNA-binding transcriptional repressor) of toxin-antitoxin stability system
MKKASVRELRNQFSRISKWLEEGESVQVLKHGKPYARIVPERKPGTFLGACPSPYPLPPDIDEPVAAEWEAGK